MKDWGQHSKMADGFVCYVAAVHKPGARQSGAIYENIDSNTVNGKWTFSGHTDIRAWCIMGEDAKNAADTRTNKITASGNPDFVSTRLN